MDLLQGGLPFISHELSMCWQPVAPAGPSAFFGRAGSQQGDTGDSGYSSDEAWTLSGLEKTGRREMPNLGMANLGGGAEAGDRVQVEIVRSRSLSLCRSLLRLPCIYYTIHIALRFLLSSLSLSLHHHSLAVQTPSSVVRHFCPVVDNVERKTHAASAA